MSSQLRMAYSWFDAINICTYARHTCRSMSAMSLEKVCRTTTRMMVRDSALGGHVYAGTIHPRRRSRSCTSNRLFVSCAECGAKIGV